MRKFSVNVNGKNYQVEVEEIGGGAYSAPVISAPVAESAPVQAAVPVQQPKANAGGGGDPVNSPMPGLILDVKVAEGQSVKEGDTLLILEAMKMENPITAPKAGVVTSVAVKKGANVNAGDVLVTIA